MAEKKGTSPLPQNTEDLTPSSNITYNSEVVSIIAGLAANEVEGIAGMCNVSGSGIIGKNRNVTKGVKVEVGTEEVAVDLYVIVEYGIPIQRAAADAQENVRKAIESMTGLHVVRVDVHVQSVSFEQEKKALQAGAQKAALVSGEAEAEAEKPAETKAAESAKESPKAEAKKPAAKESGKSEASGDAPAEKAETKSKSKKTEKKPAASLEPKAEAGETKDGDVPKK